jgi:radical SAM protein with 4Fe4S-binding SPASM domain
MKGYNDLRTLYQIDSLYAGKHDRYFPPVVVEISPTNKCNQSCRYCYTNKRIEQKESLQDNILIGSFTQLGDAGVKTVMIQGTGEPLMHKALPKAIKAGAQHSLSMTLTTNGVLLTPSVQESILEHLFYVRVSVLDHNPKRYAYMHGCSEKQWNILVNNIKNAVKFRDSNGLQVGIGITVYLYRDNFHDVYNIAEFYKDIGVDYIFIQEATPTSYSPCGKEEYASMSFSEAEISEMKEEVLTLSDDNCSIKIRFPFNDGNILEGMNKENWISNYCQGIKFYSIISSDGGVYPCWRTWGKKEYSYGSLYDNTFEEIWRNERRNSIMDLILNIPPCGDDCTNCAHSKLNEILDRLSNANTKWKDFIV